MIHTCIGIQFFSQDVFDEATFGRLYKVVPVKDTHKLRLTWALPPLIEDYGSVTYNLTDDTPA